MQKVTSKDIAAAINELGEAMSESLNASNAEQESKLRQIAAHYRLSKAREEIRSISFN